MHISKYTYIYAQFLNGVVWPYGNYFHNISGSNDYDNLMNTDPPASISYFGDYLNQPAVRQVGVGCWVFGVRCSVFGFQFVLCFYAPAGRVPR